MTCSPTTGSFFILCIKQYKKKSRWRFLKRLASKRVPRSPQKQAWRATTALNLNQGKARLLEDIEESEKREFRAPLLKFIFLNSFFILFLSNTAPLKNILLKIILLARNGFLHVGFWCSLLPGAKSDRTSRSAIGSPQFSCSLKY